MANWSAGSPVDGFTAFYFAIYLRQLWSNKLSCVRYYRFKQTVAKLNAEFAGVQQCDAQELLGCVLDNLGRDLARWDVDVIMGTAPPQNLFQEATMSWAQYKMENSSIVADLFYFQSIQTIKCGFCQWVSLPMLSTCD